MFHTGDLQSGISLAISQSKLVACFVHSPSDTHSATWETWLNDDVLLDALCTKAVILRIEAGSTEASFLAAFCPIAVTPTFVVIHNGTVLEKVEGGVAREEFLERVGRAMGVDVSVDEEAKGEVTAEQPQSQQPQAQSTQPSEPPSTAPPIDMPSLFPDRASRTAEQNAQIQAAEASARAARTAARRKEAEEAHAFHKDKGKGKASEGTDKGKEAARRDWMVQQSKAKADAKSEKARILAQIEADRAERRARSQKAPVEVSETRMSPSAEAASRRMGAGGMCALQIRLFDGSSIKKRFEPTATLEKGVREWIKSQEGVGEEPFTFKELRAPLPSRGIEFGEEQQTLFDLGLTPNATLVLVPVKGYTDAYDSSGRGYMSSALSLAYGAASGATGILGRALTYVPGFGPSEGDEKSVVEDGPSEAMREDEGEEGSARIKVKTLADQRAEATRNDGKKTEFYNGNSSAFEGRKDDDGVERKKD